MSKQNAYDVGAKLRFAGRLIGHRFLRQPRICPYCGEASTLVLVRRKKILMDILRCDTCRLIFRWPVDTPQENEVYYQHLYAQDAPQVMLPGAEELQTLRRNNFLGSHLDLNHKIRVLKALRPGGKVLDYGCSWAYAAYQLRQHGFDGVGCEIAKPRAEYGRKQLEQTV